MRTGEIAAGGGGWRVDQVVAKVAASALADRHSMDAIRSDFDGGTLIAPTFTHPS